MNIFGVGGPELIAILIIMLVFAGPKRMIHWSYILGQYIAKFRVIWSQTVDMVQQEFDEAGVDIKIPKEPPTRQNLQQSFSDAMKPMTQPIQDSLDEVKKDIDSVKSIDNELKQSTKPPAQTSPAKPKTPEPQAPSMGTWGGQTTTQSNPSTNGSSGDMGTWSAPNTDK